MAVVPFVTESTRLGERALDIFSRLLKDRIVIVGQPIMDDLANLIIAELLYLEVEDKEAEIYMYINSPGGSVTAGLAIYDTMQHVKPPISTICMGQAASMAAVLLAAGQKSKRYALPHSRILIHQPLGDLPLGQASDVKIHAEEMLRLRDELNKILAFHTGQKIEKIEKDTDRDFFMGPQAAKEYGLIDEVIEPKKIKLT
jgi:ATP-dependent Clp protease protease subunit